jgi:hypothetical protein
MYEFRTYVFGRLDGDTVYCIVIVTLRSIVSISPDALYTGWIWIAR